MAVHYNPSLVLLSVLLAILAAWAALDLAGRIARQSSLARRLLWLSLGACAMGGGIWSMHYVGMLAGDMGVRVVYHWPTVLASLASAIIAAAVALALVSQQSLSWPRTIAGSIAMAAGIVSMHYIGMSAMVMEARIDWSVPLVTLSVIVAVAISLVALRLTFSSRQDLTSFSVRKVTSALVMGCAIPSVHYIGMAAANIISTPGHLNFGSLRHTVVISDLGTTGVVVIMLLILALVPLSVGVDRSMQDFELRIEGSSRRNDLLTRHNGRLQAAFRANGVGIWECDPKTGTFQGDESLRTLYGLPLEDEVTPRDVWKTKVHPDDADALDQRWTAALASGERYESAYRIVPAPGILHYVRSIATILRDEDGTPNRILGMTWDVSAERRQEQETAELAQRFRMTLDSIADAVISTDGDQRILFLNPSAANLTGWSLEDAVGQPLEAVLVTRDERTNLPRRSPVDRAVESGGKLLVEDGVLLSRDGRRLNIRKHVALMDQGHSAVITFQDITDARRMQKDLEYTASHDALTGLPNRSAFEKLLDRMWCENRFSGRTHCLCILDLDRFKIINDTSGHLAGDALLREVSRVLQTGIQPTDMLARMGGDEFLLLLLDHTVEQAQTVARHLLNLVSQLRFSWRNRSYDFTASLGMVAFDCFSAPPDILISQADVAAFASKRDGRNCVSVYSDDKHGAASYYQEMEVVADLRRSIDTDCFELYAQPIVPIHAPEIQIYFELLLRMRDRHGQLISPALFIPAAERYGLMGQVDRWVIQHALTQYGRHAAGHFPFCFAINLSAESLSDPSLWAFVEEQFRRTGVPPNCVTFEVTETGLISNLDHAQNFLRQAQQTGSRVALDDFGTGLSSLSYLKHFPLNTLKIDGSFIRNLVTTPLDQAILKAVCQIARSMNAMTIAECVEDQETLALLSDLGVDLVQGWATGRPAPLAELLPTVRTHLDPLPPTPNHLLLSPIVRQTGTPLPTSAATL